MLGGVLRSGNSLSTWETTEFSKPLAWLLSAEVTGQGALSPAVTLMQFSGTGGGGTASG